MCCVRFEKKAIHIGGIVFLSGVAQEGILSKGDKTRVKMPHLTQKVVFNVKIIVASL